MKLDLNTVPEIKKAVDLGYRVNCETMAYEVIKDDKEQYLIKCIPNNHLIGLHGQKGTKFENKLNGDNFYIDDFSGYKIKKIQDAYFFEIEEFNIEISGHINNGEFNPDYYSGDEAEYFWDENWEEISEKVIDFEFQDKQEKATTYFLFGTEACKLFEETEGKATKEQLEYEGYGVFKAVHGVTTAFEFAEAMIGWLEFTTITKEQYERL